MDTNTATAVAHVPYHYFVSRIARAARAYAPFRSNASILAVALLAIAGNSNAGERVGIETGVGNFVDVIGIGIDSEEWKRWSVGQDWSLSLYGLGRISFWRGRAEHSENEHLVDLGAAPVLRIEGSSARAFMPYLEASIGLNLLSQTRINESRRFSTAFQFGEFLGFGATFGENRRYDIALRVEHVSNGGIKDPNDGLTYGALVFKYQFGKF